MIKSKKCVLIVEDNAEELKLSRYSLESAGLEVCQASTAGSVIDELNARCTSEKDCFNLIILDVDLPDVTGTTLGEFIRAKYKNLPIVFYTGYGRLPHIVETAEKIGATLLTKPIDPDEFVSIILSEIEKGDKPKRIKAEEIPPLIIKHILRVVPVAKFKDASNLL